jgi:hypothetical protein
LRHYFPPRVISTALECDTHGDVYGQVVKEEVFKKTLAIYDNLNDPLMAKIDLERKEEVLVAAVGLIKWILQKCAKINLDIFTNDYKIDDIAQYEHSLNVVLDDHRRNTLYSNILGHLKSVVTTTSDAAVTLRLSETLLESANSTCSFIRMLLEGDRVLPTLPDDNRRISDQFSSEEFENVFVNLFERNKSFLARSRTRARARRKQTLQRMRCILRVLSLLTLDDARKFALDARLVALLEKSSSSLSSSNAIFYLTMEDFSSLSSEMTNIVTLPDTKSFVDGHAVSIEVQLQRTQQERDNLKVTKERTVDTYVRTVCMFYSRQFSKLLFRSYI